MRKLICASLTLLLSAAMLQAGAPDDRGGRDRGGRDRGGRDRGGRDRGGDFMRRMRGGPGGFFSRRGRTTDVFDVARRSVDLTEDLQAAIAKLDAEHATKEREAIDAARKLLAKEYVLRIIEILTDEQKPKYKEIIAALDARDEVLAAARKQSEEAREACQKKLVELVGKEKADVILGRARPRPQGDAPGTPRRRPEF